MIILVKAFRLFESPRIQLLYEHNHDEVIAIERAELFFLFNFHSTITFSDYQVPFALGKYQMIFHTDLFEFGGHERLKSGQINFTQMHAANTEISYFISLYLPSITALVL